MHTGQVIKILRQHKGLTQDELSRILKVNKSSIQKYESGAVHNLKMNTIRELCNFFDIPPWVFIFPEAIQNGEELLKYQMYQIVNGNVNFSLSLNPEGVRKVLDYAKDLIDSGNYGPKKSS